MRCSAGVGFPMSRCRHPATRSVRVVDSGREAGVCVAHAGIAEKRGLYLYVKGSAARLEPRLYPRDDLEVVDVG